MVKKGSARSFRCHSSSDRFNQSNVRESRHTIEMREISVFRERLLPDRDSSPPLPHGDCEYPSWSSPVWEPFSVCFDQGVCEFYELSHYGCESDLFRLVLVDHGFVFVAHVRVVFGRDKSRHVERIAQRFCVNEQLKSVNSVDKGQLSGILLSGLLCEL